VPVGELGVPPVGEPDGVGELDAPAIGEPAVALLGEPACDPGAPDVDPGAARLTDALDPPPAVATR
jgi:hypothetical protein